MSTIETKYIQLGGSRSILEAPVGDEQPSADRIGRFRQYEGGIICSHPKAGVHELHGAILKQWLAMGREKSRIGYPTSDVLASPTGKGHCSCFQEGRIYASSAGAIHVTDLHSDKAALDWNSFNAVHLPNNWADINAFEMLPNSIDYSADVVFSRTQGTKGGGGYGCVTYSFLHILDILKQWEHPFSPAVSWHYAEWFCESFKKTNPGENPLVALANHGVASEGHCHTNWDTEVKFDPNPIMDKDHNWPLVVWDEPDTRSKNEAPLYRVKSDSLQPMLSCKPKDTAHGLLSPSVVEIKHLLRSCGPVRAEGVGHAKAIVGYNDATSEFIVLDSYLHGPTNTNLTKISYELVGASWLFSVPDNDNKKSDSLDSLQVPDALRKEFSLKGWILPDQVTVNKYNYDAAAKRKLWGITANPARINEIQVDFLVELKDGEKNLNIYDNVIAWNIYAVECFAPVINLPSDQRVTAAYAYSARFRIANNWRGTFTVSIGVEGQSPSVVWTTRGRDLRNVQGQIKNVDVDWEAPQEVTRFLDIDVPLPVYAKDHWPPRKNHRWVLTVEDHDRDGATGIITEFTLARRYLHPDCHSVGKFRTETFGGAVSVQVQDPTSGPSIAQVDVKNPPATANPNPGIVQVYVPAVADGNLPATHLGLACAITLDQVNCIGTGSGALYVEGRLLRTSTHTSTPDQLPNKEVKLMRLDQSTCKPYRWLTVATATTDAKGLFTFDFQVNTFAEAFFGVAFFPDTGDRPLASSDVINWSRKPLMEKPVIAFPYNQTIQWPLPWPWKHQGPPVTQIDH